jgi:8-oxo-dGTP diphosphatase
MPDSPSNTIEVIARGLAIRDGRLLLCRNIEHGHSYLPGGHVEFGESATAACEREYLEETGLKVQAGECCMVAEIRFIQEGVARHELNLSFPVEQLSGEPFPEHISSCELKLAFEWKSPDMLEKSDFQPHAILGPVRSLALDIAADSPSRRSSWPFWIFS